MPEQKPTRKEKTTTDYPYNHEEEASPSLLKIVNPTHPNAGLKREVNTSMSNDSNTNSN